MARLQLYLCILFLFCFYVFGFTTNRKLHSWIKTVSVPQVFLFLQYRFAEPTSIICTGFLRGWSQSVPRPQHTLRWWHGGPSRWVLHSQAHESPRALTRSPDVDAVMLPLKYQTEQGPYCRTDAHAISGGGFLHSSHLFFRWYEAELENTSHWTQISWVLLGSWISSPFPITSLRTICDWKKK